MSYYNPKSIISWNLSKSREWAWLNQSALASGNQVTDFFLIQGSDNGQISKVDQQNMFLSGNCYNTDASFGIGPFNLLKFQTLDILQF